MHERVKQASESPPRCTSLLNSASQSTEESYFIGTTVNSSLTNQEVVSFVVSAPPTNKRRSLTSSTINAADNTKLAAKLTITQKEGSIVSSTKHAEEAFRKHPNHMWPYILKTLHIRVNLP